MKTKNHILALLLFTLPFIIFAQSEYYYYKGEMINLTVDRNKLNIWTYSDFEATTISTLNFVDPIFKVDNKTIDNQNLKSSKLNFISTPTEIEFFQVINTLNNNPKIRNVSFFYERDGAEPIGTSNIFYIKLKNESDLSILEEISNQKDVDILHQNEFMPKWYKLSLKPKSLKTSIQITNEFYETGLFADVDPAFMFNFRPSSVENSNPEGCANDTNFDELWGLQNLDNQDIDINACLAWLHAEEDGNGINIAIIDQGIDKTHDDLSANISTISYDCQTATIPSIFTAGRVHGTFLSGTIAAIKDNNLQVVGIAPNSKLISISNTLTSDVTLSEELANGINFAWQLGLGEADVINCSWGDHNGQFYDDFHSTLLENSIDSALELGRNGLGSIIVFSSGNRDNIDYPAYYHEDLLCVGAINSEGIRSTFAVGDSGAGSQLDIVAPGSNIVSTLPNNEIENIEHAGTSTAAAYISGVSALILGENPCLSGKQVREIIETSAQKVGTYNYENTSERVNGTWNEETGYGLVDAWQSVLLAQDTHSPTLDLYIKDSPDELGIEPNEVTEHMWTSKDIWIRNNDDGGLEHQNPEYKSDGTPNFIYVRVINKSCVASIGNESLTINWAKANTALTWPENWDGTLVNDDNFPLGGVLPDTGILQQLQPGEEDIVVIPWWVPNPDNYTNGDGSDNPWHFCLLAQLNATNDPLTYPMTFNPNWMVRNNNNLAWKNLTVVDLVEERSARVMVANPYNSTKSFYLELQKEANEKGKAIFDEAEVTLKMDSILFDAWERGGKESQLLNATNDEKRKLVKGENVILENILFEPKERGLLTLDFNFLTKEITDKTEYVYHVIQKDSETDEIIGGETFIIKKKPRPIFLADAGNDIEVDVNESITISAEQINEAAIYNWYDMEGNLIYTGKDLTISSNVTKKYKLEIIADTDGYKDFDEIEVKIRPYSLETLAPNPAENQVTVNYKALNATSAYLMIIGTNNGTSNNYILDTNIFETTIDISNYQVGFYTIALICDGEIVDAKTLLKQ